MIHPPQVRPEEPIAVTPHDGIYGGESQQWLSYPTNPHVRFDERGREAERCRMAQATAPVLDSTMDRRTLTRTCEFAQPNALTPPNTENGLAMGGVHGEQGPRRATQAECGYLERLA